MATGSWFLRIAEPIEAWDATSTMSLPAAAEILGSDGSWSLFACAEPTFERTVVGAYYGSRTGRGPMHSIAYVRLARELLEALPAARLDHTPHNFTFGWPQEVADAHYDLLPMDARTASTVLQAVRSAGDSLIHIPRVELLTEQVRLLRRDDCSDRYRGNVGQRLRKLSVNEQPVFQQLVERCKASQVEPPTKEDFRG